MKSAIYFQIREKDQKSKLKPMLERCKSLGVYQEELKCDLSCILALEIMDLEGMWPSGYPGNLQFNASNPPVTAFSLLFLLLHSIDYDLTKNRQNCSRSLHYEQILKVTVLRTVIQY